MAPKQHPNLLYIPCKVVPGMFRGEYLAYANVLQRTVPPREVVAQLFVDEDLVRVKGTPQRNSPVEGWLRVSFVEPSNGLLAVILPQPPVTPDITQKVLVPADSVKQEAQL